MSPKRTAVIGDWWRAMFFARDTHGAEQATATAWADAVLAAEDPDDATSADAYRRWLAAR